MQSEFINQLEKGRRERAERQKKCPCLGRNSWPETGNIWEKRFGALSGSQMAAMRDKADCYEKLMRQAMIV